MVVCLYAESTIFDPPNKAAQSADEGVKERVSFRQVRHVTVSDGRGK